MKNLRAVTDDDKEKAKREHKTEAAKLTRAEISDRVRLIRAELQTRKEQYDGALFDCYGDASPSLDIGYGENAEPYGAVYYLAPLLEKMVERLQENKDISDDVFELYFWGATTAYQVGMLAGAIFGECPPRVIDRFERGLTVALGASHWIAKSTEGDVKG